MMRMAAVLATLALLPLPAAQAASCKGLNARYTVPGAKGFELKLEKAKETRAWSDLDVTVKTPSHAFRFSLTASNGYSYNYLVQEDPKLPSDADSDAGSYRIFLFDKSANILELPNAKSKAPAMIFVPDLGGALYYGSETREFVPTAMWRLKGCG
jgi:hypothetical protein